MEAIVTPQLPKNSHCTLTQNSKMLYANTQDHNAILTIYDHIDIDYISEAY